MSFELHTKDLILTPIESKDFDWFLRFNRSGHVRKFLWDDEIMSETLCGELIQKSLDLFKTSDFGIWKASTKEKKEAIGYGGLWYFFGENQPQLIYAIDQSVTGMGYASQIGRIIINYSFSKLKFSYLIASLDSGHNASKKVAIRIGMTHIETKCINSKPTDFYRIENQI